VILILLDMEYEPCYNSCMVRFSVNESFFDEINTEEKAYILGFICADGYLIKNGFGIDVNYIDEQILHRIYNAMQYNGNIRTATHGMKRLCITSKKLYNNLVKYGITRRKSYDLSSLNIEIPKDLQNHFVRGYFDGDGSLTHEKVGGKYHYTRNRIYIRGTKEFLEYIDGMVDTIFSWYYNKTYVIYISRKERVKQFMKWLYNNATIYLERKHARYELMVSATHLVTDESKIPSN